MSMGTERRGRLRAGCSRGLEGRREDSADGAEDAALHLHHLEGSAVIGAEGGAGAILEEKAFEASVVGFAHGGVDADIGRDPGEHEVADAAPAEDQVEIGGAKDPLPGLSITGSHGSGESSGMISHPGSPRTRIRPQGPGSPMPAPIWQRQRLLSGRSERSGRWPSRV